MSPNTPPRPVGSGQVGGGVTQPAIAAESSDAPNHARARRGMRSTPRAVAKKNAPDHRRHQRGDRGQAEELHGEIGEHRAGIAHGVGDRVVGGVAEARIGDVPRAKAGEAEGDGGQKRQARRPADLPARECLKAVPRLSVSANGVAERMPFPVRKIWSPDDKRSGRFGRQPIGGKVKAALTMHCSAVGACLCGTSSRPRNGSFIKPLMPA